MTETGVDGGRCPDCGAPAERQPAWFVGRAMCVLIGVGIGIVVGELLAWANRFDGNFPPFQP